MKGDSFSTQGYAATTTTLSTMPTTLPPGQGASRDAACVFSLAIGCALFLFGSAVAQSDWTYYPEQEPSAQRALAFDDARGVTIMVGGNPGHPFVSTHEWDGTTWTRRSTSNSPRARKQMALAYQAGTGRTLLFGGWADDQTPVLDETWEYDGTSWVQLQPINAPSPRTDAVMAWDAGRNRMVLFGGEAGGAFLVDTWEWDGTNWQQMQPMTQPTAAVADTEMCFDEATQRVLMVMTTRAFNSSVRGTWSWDGSNWTQLRVDAVPSSLRHETVGLVYDSVQGRPVLMGDDPIGGTRIFVWSGQAWSANRLPSLSDTFLRSKPAFDRSRGVLVFYAAPDNVTWEFAGGAWVAKERYAAVPLDFTVMAYDPSRQVTVLVEWFDGGVRTWESNAAGGWTVLAEQLMNVPRQPTSAMAVVFDEVRQQLILVTATFPGGAVQVWGLMGNTWVLVPPATTAPTPRSSFSVGWDGQGVVLFGGFAGSNWINDTWVWDGSDWSQSLPNNSPPPRGKSSLAFDRHRGRLILFGGETRGARLSDTWEWNGADWQQSLTANAPSDRFGHFSTFDSIRDRVIVFGGNRAAGGVAADLWEYDGVDWARQSFADPVPKARVFTCGAFDETLGWLRIFGGPKRESWFGLFRAHDTWSLKTRDPAVAAGFGVGCAGGMGVPSLRTQADSKPWFGDSFGLAVDNVASGASAVVLLGLSNTTWGNTPLPFDLGLVGGSRVRSVG